MLSLFCFGAARAAAPAGAATLFEDEGAIAHAVVAIRDKVGSGPIRALKIEINDNSVVLQAQDPNDRRHVNEWRFTRGRLLGFSRERVSDPKPVGLDQFSSDLDTSLFDLDSVNFSDTGPLLQAAIGRSHLEDPGRVIRAEIARTTLILPERRGDVRWTIAVGSGRENATVYATAAGRVFGADLSGTNYARTMDMTAGSDQIVQSIDAVSEALGPGDKLVRVAIRRSEIAISTNLPDDSFPIAMGKAMTPRVALRWTPSGLQRLLGRIVIVEQQDEASFAANAVDWTMLPRLEDAARQSLDMPQGRIDTVTVSKPTDRLAEPAIIWNVAVVSGKGDQGSVDFDVAGNVLLVVLPESSTGPSDWRQPPALTEALKRIDHEFGPTQFTLIQANERTVGVVARDPRQPDSFASFTFGTQGLRRSRSLLAMRLGDAPPFTIADLKPLTAERLASLESRALARMKLPIGSITDITIGRGGMDPSPRGTVAVTVTAEIQPPMGPHGRVVYEMDGTVIQQYLPEAMSFLPPQPTSGSYAAGYFDCEKTNEADRAITGCTRVIDDAQTSASDRAYAFTNRGIAYGHKGDYDREIADESEAIRLDPQDEHGFTNRGLAYARKGDADRAIADFTKAIQLAPTLALAFGNRGLVYLEKGDLDHAIADAGEALRLDPENLGALRLRGRALAGKGAFEAAIADFTAALAVSADDVRAFTERASAYIALRDWTHAIADRDALVARAQNDGWAVFSRGRVYFYAGDLAKAQADFRQSSPMAPHSAYPALWSIVATIRATPTGRASEPGVVVDGNAWLAQVSQFLTGDMTQAELVAAAASSDAKTQRGQVCEANFYGGERALARQQKSESVRLLTLAANDCPPDFIEREGARAELGASILSAAH